MPLSDWMAQRQSVLIHRIAEVEPLWPWDASTEPEASADVVAEAEAYLRAHSAMRDL